MSKYAVVCKHVTKRYIKGQRYQPTLREWISLAVTQEYFKRPKFKALDDVSFKIKKGQVVGFIGSNGAGKSTMLKIILKITRPNEGTVKTEGSVAGLLELGTGFHPELTGKENVYLYGAVLGLSRKQVDSIYDAVVDFAGLQEFMETPFKHYSSGMRARLGFAVSIHIEPDILLIDEVLAVGDMHFQNKCINYMKNYCRDPKHTVVFVSHNNDNVRAICDRVIWFENGKIKEEGDTKEILKRYEKFQNERE